MKFILKIFTLVFLLISSNAFADDSKQAEQFINNVGNKIISIASNKKFSVDQRRDQLVSYIDSIVDSEWVAKFVLGKYYRAATDDQKNRFKELYRQFMINTYAPKFNGYGDQTFEIKTVINQEKYYLVKCLFYPKDSPEVTVDFRIRKKPDNLDFVVLDVVAEGVSLIETQRSEFGSAIATNGLDKFLDDLQLRVKELKKNPPKEAPKAKK